jgi:hypothetical protein
MGPQWEGGGLSPHFALQVSWAEMPSAAAAAFAPAYVHTVLGWRDAAIDLAQASAAPATDSASFMGAAAEFDFSSVSASGRSELFRAGGAFTGEDDRGLTMIDHAALSVFNMPDQGAMDAPLSIGAFEDPANPDFFMADMLPPFSEMLVPNIEWGG